MAAAQIVLLLVLNNCQCETSLDPLTTGEYFLLSEFLFRLV